MAEVIRMPKLSDTMEEGTLVEWHKKEGDKVESGELLAEIETDKATMDFDSPEDGVLLHLGLEKGDTVPVDALLAVIGKKGEDFKAILEEEKNAQASNAASKDEPKEEKAEEKKPEPVAAAPAAKTESTSVAAPVSMPSSNGSGKVKASPLAKKMASEAGIAINQLSGSGDEGRIVKRDVEAYLQNPPAGTNGNQAAQQPVVIPQVVGEESHEDIKLSQMRKTIARRLSESKFGAPHFYLTMEINMDKAIEARKSMNEVAPVKISFNDMVIKAVAVALRQNPKVNVSWLDDKLRINNHIHIGMAVAVDEGLVVPVIRFADNKTLSHISVEAKEWAQKARDKKIQPDDMQGNTFTISNLGMFGIEEFTAIINPPDACILAIGGIKQTPIVKDGEIVPGNVMKVTLSCDHRAVDGAVGSAFLKSLKSLLEDPVRLLI